MFDLPPPVLSVLGLSHSYGCRPTLHDCTLSLYPGECLAIVGASGSGKSTLVSLLAGRQRLQNTASYRLAGVDMRAENGALHLRRVSGYVGQNAERMLDLRLSAAANIASRLLDLGRRGAKGVLAESRNWLERLGLGPSGWPIRSAASRAGCSSGCRSRRH